MIERLLPWLEADRFRRNRINREPSPMVATGLPWLSIMLLSMASFSPVIASATVMPPLSFMLLLGWRMMRPGMLPVWAGAPLGAFDDLYSGQPFGSAMTLWSLAMIAMEAIDGRFRYRGFVQDWAVAALLFTAYILLAALIVTAAGGSTALYTVVPQMALTILLYPAITGLVTLLDRLRLMPLRTVSR